MRKKIISGLLVMGIAVAVTGCGENVPLVVNNMSNEKKCAAYNNQLLKVNKYLDTVSGMSAFHLEEAAVAMDNPQISISNNKKDMLKDANQRKIDILTNMKTYGCKPYTLK